MSPDYFLNAVIEAQVAERVHLALTGHVVAAGIVSISLLALLAVLVPIIVCHLGRYGPLPTWTDIDAVQPEN